MSGSKIYGTLHNGILLSRNKEGAPTLCDSMYGTGEHYAKRQSHGKDKYHMISPLIGT